MVFTVCHRLRKALMEPLQRPADRHTDKERYLLSQEPETSALNSAETFLVQEYLVGQRNLDRHRTKKLKTNSPSRKKGISTNYSGNWCPTPACVSTPKRCKGSCLLPSLHEISQTDRTLAGDTWLTPDSMVQVMFEVRLFCCWLAQLLELVWCVLCRYHFT